ncbi:MFS transporter [Streptoalloteichus hindustanus]|uniref:Sugar phosphate permease n=1 Tax=Streptoalloteichus hindustanus TaxID=2017 RepID=A0A1M5CYV3_STRHI|nr:MFS transporter [Streptoalloteichus hindustanus]SHF59909.1 Sugar phosphate permease [Streptoalloteichus hindustanus]
MVADTDTRVRGVTAARTVTITIAVLTLAWLVDYVDRAILPVALPLIGADLGLSASAQGLVLTVSYAVYAASQIPAGIIADRMGSARTMVAGLVAWSVCTAATGLVAGFWGFLGARVLFAVSVAALPAASMKAMAERADPDRRMTAYGVMFCTTEFAGALSPLVVGPLLATLGWRPSFLLVAAAGVVTAPVVWWLLPPPRPTAGGEPESGREPESGGERLGLAGAWRVLRVGVLWRFALLFGGINIIGFGVGSWLPSYLVEVQHVGVGWAGVASTAPQFLEAVAIMVGGVLFDRYFHHRPQWLVVPALAVTGLLITAVLFVDGVAPFLVLVTLAVGVRGLAVMSVYGLPLRSLPAEISGTVNGLINFGGQVSGAVAPLAMGVLIDVHSYTAAFAFLLFGVAVSVAAAFWIPRTPEDFSRRITALTATGDCGNNGTGDCAGKGTGPAGRGN